MSLPNVWPDKSILFMELILSSRAVDDHHRRLERIEAKVFNGHGSER